MPTGIQMASDSSDPKHHETQARRRPWAGLHSSRTKFRFDVEVFDFMLQWLMGAQTHGGSEVGESLHAASQIRDGDPVSWINAWTAMAARVEQRAKESLAGGHQVSARESYLRAYSYYRAPLVFLSPIEHPQRFRSQYEHAQACFRRAACLFDPPVEPVDIPFEGTHLPGYMVVPSANRKPRKTLIMAGGGDTFVEDLYAYIGPAGTKRDWNVLIVDFPLQGVLPFEGLTMRADYEVPMGAVVDWLLTRPEVHADRIAAFGISGGGYLVPRAVAFEKRIHACVALSMMLDVHKVWTETMGARWLVRAEKFGLLHLAEYIAPRRLRAGLALFDTYKWRYGADTFEDMLKIAAQAHVDPSLITCPTLILVAEQEYEQFGVSRQWQDEALAKIDHPTKQLVVLPRDEGADSHSGGTNLSLVGQLVFDWLDDVFDQPESTHPEHTLAQVQS